MTSTPVERVRQTVCTHLAGLSNLSVSSLHETILIRNGLYCGRKFQAEGYEVVWFIEEDEIKFFGPCGNLLSAHSLISFLQAYEQTDQPQFLTETKAA